MKQFLKYTLATLCGLLLFSIVSTFFFFALLGGIAAMGSATVTKAEPHSIYCLEMSGSVAERTDDDTFSAAMMELAGRSEDSKYGLNDIVANIRKAKDNSNIDGICLRGGTLDMGSATAQVIRRELAAFKESGKFVVAYADDYSRSNYYVASVADRVLINPSGSLNWNGMSITLEFFKRVLDKLGVEMQVVKVGSFKSAVEPYIRTSMSDENRLQYSVLLSDIWQQVVSDVAASRGIGEDDLNRLADRYMGLQPAEEYLAAGLVDSLCYAEGLDSVLTSLCGTDDFTLLSHADMLSVADADNSYKKDKIAVIYAEGDITDKTGDGIVGEEMVETIGKLAEKDNVKAVVLRVNSPGGSAYASEQICHALTLLKEKKPLVVSMGDYAASGGYYISSPAQYIFAETTTLTGSIGIFGVIPNVGGLADKVGLDFDGIATHRHSDFESNVVLKGMNTEERAMLQAEINRGYELFTRRCAEGRNIPQDSVKAVGEGRVWSGRQALKLGLIDETGSLADAIAKAAELAELENYEIAEYPELDDELTRLLKAFGAETMIDRIVCKAIGEERWRNIRYMESLTGTDKVQARLPYNIRID